MNFETLPFFSYTTKAKILQQMVDDINTKKLRQPQNEDILKTENDLENEDKLRN